VLIVPAASGNFTEPSLVIVKATQSPSITNDPLTFPSTHHCHEEQEALVPAYCLAENLVGAHCNSCRVDSLEGDVPVLGKEMDAHGDIDVKHSEAGFENVADNSVVGVVDRCIDQALGGFRGFGTFHYLLGTLRKSSSRALCGKEEDEVDISCQVQTSTTVS
jgi:hypothetical protein